MLYYMDDYTSSIKIDTFRGICLIKIVAHMHVSIAIFAEQCTHIVSTDLEIFLVSPNIIRSHFIKAIGYKNTLIQLWITLCQAS